MSRAAHQQAKYTLIRLPHAAHLMHVSTPNSSSSRRVMATDRCAAACSPATLNCNSERGGQDWEFAYVSAEHGRTGTHIAGVICSVE